MVIFDNYIGYLVISCSLHYIHPCPCNIRMLPITITLNVMFARPCITEITEE